MRFQILIPVTSILSSFLAFSVVWWAWQRRKEREAYYRYELSRLMLERAPNGADRVLAWMREQQQRERRNCDDMLRLGGWILLLGGAAVLVGLRFTANDEALFGWVPIGVGLALFLFLLLARREP